jgi:hypothetical protein
VDIVQLVRERGRLIASTPLGRRLASLYRSRLARNFVRVTVGLLVIFFFAYAVVTNWDELSEYQWRIDYRYFAAALLFYGVNFTVVLVAWHRVMASVEAMPDLSVNVRAFCYSSLMRRIPGVLWYIASRTEIYKDAGVARSVTVVSTVLETILLIVTGLFVYLASLIFPTTGVMAASLAPGLVLLLLAPFSAILHPALFNRLFCYVLTSLNYQGTYSLGASRLAPLLVIYIVAWVLGGVELLILARAIYPVPVSLLPAIIGAWAASGAASLIAAYAVQGMGLTEVTLAVLLSTFLPLPVSIAISILFRLLCTIGDVVWALLIVSVLPRLLDRR